MGTVQRIQQYIENKGISKYRFYQQSGLSNGALDKGENIGSDKCEKILYAFPDLNSDWLLTGRGSMLKNNGLELIDNKEDIEKNELPEVNYEYKGAPYYNVDFIGGFDLVLNDQTNNPDYYINFPPYNKEGVVWCNITGHSMEPELNNGDFIALKEMTDPIEYLPYGEIYGIITDNYRTVKRIRMSERKGFVRLIPTNKSPEYGEQEIPINMIRKVFAVLGSMHRLF
ncbi:MAG: helix-turn-helix transcriptional regulator [Parabacteroides merdae]|jgi:phage repressor protein C with HTH and peptisase S24 domain